MFSKRTFTTVLLVVCWMVFAAQNMQAQSASIYEQGFKPYGSFQAGDIDTINLLNRELTLRIPILSYPQRGNKLHLAVEIVNYIGFVQVSQWSSNCSLPCYTYQLPPAGVGISIDKGFASVRRDTTFPYQVWVTSWDGAVHETQTLSLDGTGYKASVSNNVCPSSDSVTDRDGVIYTSGCTTTSATSFFDRIEDSNGNQITYNDAPPYSHIDSMNRTIPGVSSQTSDYSGCAGTLATSSAFVITLPGPNGGTLNYKECQAKIYFNMPGICNGDPRCEPVNGQYKELVQSILLPNGASWVFQYASADPNNPQSVGYGDLLKVTFPTGGSISYTWQNLNAIGCRPAGNGQPFVRAVTSRTVDANDGQGPQTWTYSTGTVQDPLGNQTVHTFSAFPPGMSNSCSFYETMTRQYQGASTGGTLLQTVQTDYVKALNSNDPNYQFYKGLASRVTTTLANGQQTKVEMDYQYPVLSSTASPNYPLSDGNVVTKREYNYGSTFPLLRTTIKTYEDSTNSNYLNNNLLNLIASQTVKNAAGVQVSSTLFNYDEYSLTGSGIATQHDSTPPNGIYRGNQTSITRWLNGTAVSTAGCSGAITNGYEITSYSYYDTGMLRSSRDPCSHVTSFLYSSAFAGAYATSTTNALNQSTSTNYDFNTGLKLSFTDLNLKTTSFAYDNMLRATSINYPDTGQTKYFYNDNAGSASVERTQTFDSTDLTKLIDSFTYFDGLGRPNKTKLVSDPDPHGATYTATVYDPLGRPSKVFNATRCNTPTTNCGESTWGSTAYYYDALGRTCLVVPPDGVLPGGTPCQAPAPSNDIFTSYAGNCTTVTDQAGNARTSCSDPLGRLTSVSEDPAVSNYLTSYGYDALDNLTTVVQVGSRQRIFTYNSLSQLVNASNPESGTVTYSYDKAGNLVTKVAPAPNQTGSSTVTLSYCYDVLNRLVSKAYTAQSCPMASPVATYLYDQGSYQGLTITNGIGRRTGMTDAAGAEAWSYDAMGRPLFDQRTTNALSNLISYTYNLDGSMLTVNAPPRALRYDVRGAGRPVSVTSNGSTILEAAQYTPNGALCYIQGDWNYWWRFTNTFNNRLQPVTMQAVDQFPQSTPPVPACQVSPIFSGGYALSVLDLTYSFVNPITGHNNGNVASVTNNLDSTRSVAYTYDSLNRIATAGTKYTTNLSRCWGEQYSYDPWGNLLSIKGIQPRYNGCVQESGFDFTNSMGANNRITDPAYSYDAAGNLIAGPAVGTSYHYDAENHLVSASGVNYTYDGDGKRVMKSTGTIYWYGAGFDVLTERNFSNAEIASYTYFNGKRMARTDYSNQTVFFITDHLGSTRFLNSNAGLPGNGTQYDTDYYPFGAERLTSGGGPPNGYKFTGKERDSESGLDNFGARYDSSSMGRFMSPDPETSSGYDNPGDPQGWNAYSYARNNPVNLTDPDGRDYNVCIDNGNGSQNCTSYANLKDFQNAAKASDATVSGDDKSGQILVNGQSIGSYKFFVGPGVEGAGVPDITADYFFNFPALFSGVKLIFNLGRAAGTFELMTIGSGAKLARAAAVREGLRASGGYIDRVFQTSAGPVRVLARVEAEGETAVIKELAVYPTESAPPIDVSYTQMRQGFRGVLSDLKEAGYSDFRMEPQYRSFGPGASGGANPGGWTGTLKGKL